MALYHSGIANIRRVAIIGNHLPRRCGIATFTSDLAAALEENLQDRGSVEVMAMDDVLEGYTYPERVKFQINAKSAEDYERAADFININRFDLVILQHEYGIFGGADGSRILTTLAALQVPCITTLHTILTDPSEGQRRVLERIAKLSERLVVMSRKAVEILSGTYDIPAERIAYIPHGIPDVPFSDPSFHKDLFGVERNKVILTFGLLGPSKGLEHMIDAMPPIVERHPEAVFLALGATHPHVIKKSGESYRQSLVQRARQLKVEDHVLFHNRFVNFEELCQYLSSADIYVTPYQNEAQITSGTLAYACGCGKAVVSTPYWHATELLADDRGVLVPFNDTTAFAEAINTLLDDEHRRNDMRKRVYQHCRSMIWKEVGRDYLELGGTVIGECQRHPKVRAGRERPEGQSLQELPEASLLHLRTMTDDTGMLQHADYSIPKCEHGYCTDDNARALIVTCMHYWQYQDELSLQLMHRYLAFLHYALNRENGWFRNFMHYERHWLEERGSEDSHGRALWGLGMAVKYHPSHEICEMCAGLFHEALPVCEHLEYSRAIAFTLVGLHAYLEVYRGDSDARRLRTILAERLQKRFNATGGPDWPWLEEEVSYANGIICLAMLLCGQWLPDDEIYNQGIRALQWLMECQTGQQGQLTIIGNQEWMTRDGKRSTFAQQPLEAMNLLLACIEAYRATQNTRWAAEARRCLDWFVGFNDLGLQMCVIRTGACRDGLHAQGMNPNQGAESTLAWLTSCLAMQEISEANIKQTQKTRRIAKP